MNETNPNQKTVRVEKERCDKNNLYAMYNLQDRAVAEFVQKGYLVNTQWNNYNFYERPRREEMIITVNKDETFSF